MGIIDIVPSLAEFAGVSAPEEALGRSFLGLMAALDGDHTAAAPGEPRVIFGFLEKHLFRKYDQNRLSAGADVERYLLRAAMRDGWKLIVDSRGKASLYDRLVDPGEMNDVLGNRPGVAAEMARAVHGYAAREPVLAPSTFEKSLTPEEIERLRSLGYVD